MRLVRAGLSDTLAQRGQAGDQRLLALHLGQRDVAQRRGGLPVAGGKGVEKAFGGGGQPRPQLLGNLFQRLPGTDRSLRVVGIAPEPVEETVAFLIDGLAGELRNARDLDILGQAALEVAETDAGLGAERGLDGAAQHGDRVVLLRLGLQRADRNESQQQAGGAEPRHREVRVGSAFSIDPVTAASAAPKRGQPAAQRAAIRRIDVW
jgi:hypothetical protein